jgi:hypothetical protein
MPVYQAHLFCTSIRDEGVNNPALLAALKDYPKFCSVAALRAAGLPVLDMMLFSQWSSVVEQAVHQFISRYHAQRVLIRTETWGGGMGSPSRQGVEIGDIAAAVVELLTQFRTCMVGIQIAGNIFRNLYNINLMLNPWCPMRYLLEITGPGFTARDLNRYGMLHEQLAVPSYAVELSSGLIQQTYCVPDDIYEQQREEKKLSQGIQRLEQAELNDYLILKYNRYPPIPINLLQVIWQDMPAIRKAVEDIELRERGAVVSASFLMQGGKALRHFYWDIHPMQ